MVAGNAINFSVWTTKPTVIYRKSESTVAFMHPFARTLWRRGEIAAIFLRKDSVSKRRGLRRGSPVNASAAQRAHK